MLFAPNEDSTKVYTDMDLWVRVRRYVLVEGHSKRSACKTFGLNWRTMQKMLEHAEPPGYRRDKPVSAKKIDRFLPVLHQWLEGDRTAPRKQRHTSKRIYERLRDEHGFDGGLTFVKDAVRSWRKVHAQTYVPLSHPPGEAQVDFGETSFHLNGVLTKAALFVMSLPYPGSCGVRFRGRAYPRECTESLQDGHVSAFAFFGGVPTRISYDNSRPRKLGEEDRQFREALGLLPGAAAEPLLVKGALLPGAQGQREGAR